MRDGWTRVPLGELVTLQRGHDLPTPRRRPGSVPILGSFGITGWHDEVRAPGPGLTVGRSGASFGVVTFSEVDFWPLNTALYATDFHGNDPRFTYYLLKTFDFARYNSGSAQPSLNRNYIHPVPVAVPPLEDQRRIAGILGALDDKIQMNLRASETLEETAQTLFMSWFPDSESDPSDEGGCLADAVDLLRDLVDPQLEPDTVFQHYSLPAYDAGRQAISEPGVGIRSSKLAVPWGSVLLSKLNPGIERVWLPDIKPDDRAICSTEFLVLRPRVGVGRAFVYEFLRSAPFRNTLTSLVTGTTGSHQRSHADAILRVPMRLPSPSQAAQFERLVGPILDRIAVARGESRTLVAFRDALLPRLLGGEMSPSFSGGQRA